MIPTSQQSLKILEINRFFLNQIHEKTTVFFLKYSAMFNSYIVAAIIDDLTIYGFSPQLYEYIVYWICALKGHVLFSF